MPRFSAFTNFYLSIDVAIILSVPTGVVRPAHSTRWKSIKTVILDVSTADVISHVENAAHTSTVIRDVLK